MRVEILALIRPVSTSTDERWIASSRWIPEARGLLRQAGDKLLHLLTHHHYHVRQLVDDDHDIGEMGEVRHCLGLVYSQPARLGHEQGIEDGLPGRLRLRVRDPTVVAGDVAHAELGHQAVPAFHLRDAPAQGIRRLFHVRDHGGEQVRNALVDRELQHLGVHHDQTRILRRGLVQQTQDHHIDGHGFSRTRGAGD